MEQKNKQTDSAVYKVVKALAAKACFAASTRKGTEGMKLQIEWALERFIMCMRSPWLYGHICKNKVMTLPFRTTLCLKLKLKSYRSRSSPSKKVFAAVTEKEDSMYLFLYHLLMRPSCRKIIPYNSTAPSKISWTLESSCLKVSTS